MRAVLVTQEERLYIPLFLSKVFAEYDEVTSVVILPMSPIGENNLSYFKRFFGIFGFRDSIMFGALFIRNWLMGMVGVRWNNRFYSVTSAAKAHGVPVYRIKNINAKDSLHLIKKLNPDIIVSVAAPQVFRDDFIRLAKYTINIHAALLPKYRGIMPSFWVLAKGEEKTGVTVHHMAEHVDSGNIILQKIINISLRDTLHSLQSKVAKAGACALLEALRRIEAGEGNGKAPQGKGSYYTFPTREAAREFRSKGRRFI